MVGAMYYVTWADSINATSSIGGFEARVVRDERTYSVAGVDSLFYGHFTYRRPTPTTQFVNWLPALRYD